MGMKEDLLKIINHYGINKQLKYIHSEYFELDEAILESEKASEWTISMVENWNRHIAEEISDVMVMLKQFQYYYDISDEHIEKIMKQKIKRQLESIEKEKKQNPKHEKTEKHYQNSAFFCACAYRSFKISPEKF